MSKTKCKKCGYEWEYKGKLAQVTCPNCGYKTPATKRSVTPKRVEVETDRSKKAET